MIPKNYRYQEGHPKKYLYFYFKKIDHRHVVAITDNSIEFANGEWWRINDPPNLFLRADAEETISFHIKQFLRSFK